ncbi:gamma-glutamyl-gamma-aminobutyrate hydrolase family protein [Phaeobacter italicus]|uniref:gamma-glutamyl-gamma-aminobutyrate hydrolase family protein n=1 Tax=Phaeobacter italicus TaxID=481446 RepID=UPI001CD5F758|nr:gamma-glutamyl-gamma-aminobutyrate hydrolase family protein [Phaeobacter italicus]MCA0858410.1 gamma-glutamyl-gamma-aminobutyrate hydrolase family protein [Phaeobacter italicus]
MRPVIALLTPPEHPTGEARLLAAAHRLAGARVVKQPWTQPIDRDYVDGIVIVGSKVAEQPEITADNVVPFAQFQSHGWSVVLPPHLLDLLRHDSGSQIPVLAVNGGCQWLNLARGGSIYNDAAAFYGVDLDTRLMARQEVSLISTSGLRRVMDRLELEVNCTVNQAVSVLGRGLQVVGRDSKGMIQAVEDPHHAFFVGVQWAPEYLLHKRAQRRLLRAFVRAASAIETDAEVPHQDQRTG